MILTGAKQSKAFCAGADLKEWLELYSPSISPILYMSISLLRPCLNVVCRRTCFLGIWFCFRVGALMVGRGRAWMGRVWELQSMDFVEFLRGGDLNLSSPPSTDTHLVQSPTRTLRFRLWSTGNCRRWNGDGGELVCLESLEREERLDSKWEVMVVIL